MRGRARLVPNVSGSHIGSVNDAFVEARPDSGEPCSPAPSAERADFPGLAVFPGAGVPTGFWRGPWGAEREEATSGAQLEGSVCPHCREQASVALPGGEGWCAACGGLVAPNGEAEVVCRRCALPHALSAGRGRSCAGGPVMTGPTRTQSDEVAARLRELLGTRFRVTPGSAAGCYVAAVCAAVTPGPWGEASFAGVAEPLVFALPDRTLVVSAGVVAALEDEAQFAFLLAREESLMRGGWISRRYFNASHAPFWSFWRRRDDQSLARAAELTWRVGFGTDAEQLADREALAALVGADYDPQAGPRALALLDRASRASGRFRLSRLRSRLLGRSLADIGRPALARLNREVYRRALAAVRQPAG